MDTKSGKVTVLTMFLSIFVVFLGILLDVGSGGNIPTADAANATTSVTIKNSAPLWLVDAQESTESSTSTPTNASTTISWTGTGDDGNGEDFYLIVCSTSTPPTPASGAAPSCAVGSTEFGVSISTTDETQATVTYTARDIDAESIAWYAFVCDGNSGSSPACNSTYKQGSGNTVSPFVVNHRPNFIGYWDDSGTLGIEPGGLVTWYATSSDPDLIRGGDTVELIVCRANDYIPATQECGVGGYYSSSTPAVALNPTATTTLASILQDKDYPSYGYTIDNYGLMSAGVSATDSILTVGNATPLILSSGVLLSTSTAIIPSVESGETPGIELSVIISDANSCENSASGPEITSIAANVFRSGIGSSTCLLSGDYDAEFCYPEAVGAATWNLSCSQRAGSCLGSSDPEAIYDCTFPVWHIADPTDAGSEFPLQNWLATAQAFDDDFATSTWTEGTTGQEVQQFLSYNVATTSIPYGELEPGQANTTTVATTTVESTGNVGLDVNLSGTDMCPDSVYPLCSGLGTSTIPVTEQVYATSTVLYAAGIPLTLGAVELELNAPKSSSTSTPFSADTTWAINIPFAISQSGDYVGENTLIGIVGEAIDW